MLHINYQSLVQTHKNLNESKIALATPSPPSPKKEEKENKNKKQTLGTERNGC